MLILSRELFAHALTNHLQFFRMILLLKREVVDLKVSTPKNHAAEGYKLLYE